MTLRATFVVCFAAALKFLFALRQLFRPQGQATVKTKLSQLTLPSSLISKCGLESLLCPNNIDGATETQQSCSHLPFKVKPNLKNCNPGARSIHHVADIVFLICISLRRESNSAPRHGVFLSNGHDSLSSDWRNLPSTLAVSPSPPTRTV